VACLSATRVAAVIVVLWGTGGCIHVFLSGEVRYLATPPTGVVAKIVSGSCG
jgi:hypothetical protein